MPVEFRDLRWAIVASQHRSLRQAAEALNIKQSTLSRRLRNLECKLGSTLFERTNGGTRPTIEGQEFLDAARRVVGETDAMTARLKTRSRGESGRLTIGIHTSLSAGNLRAILLEHRHRFPDVDRQLVDGGSDHLISDLASSAVDVALVAAPNQKWRDRSLLLWSERVVAALPANHPLTGRDVVHWGELRHESLLMSRRGPGPEFLELLISKLGSSDPCLLLRHDVVLDRGEIDLSTGALIQERRTDIVYGWNDTTQGMRLVFEFKRMGRQKKHRNHYLLEQGLGRFVTGIYSRRQAVAAMVGVLLDPEADVVPPIREALEDAALATALRLKPTSGGDPIARPSNMFRAADFDTEHERDPSLAPTHGTIRVSHFFLAFGIREAP
ncbi:LysR family transcriptional regulator [Bradyrhizobium sp. RT9a]|uniref:LysR family transcriptional regulator n=1 Tax=Bradyrhizobium sp. RT9a TaxID=3156384 RepID=UPI003399B683